MSDPAPTTPVTTDPAGVPRTATGNIASQEQTTVSTATTPQTSTTPEPTQAEPEEPKSLINQEGKSLANQTPAPVPEGAPESYAAFSVPEGWELDADTASKLGPMFKGMNLSQAQAQQLVDFYVAKASESQNAPFKFWQDTQDKWVREVKADPVLGPRLNEVKTTISRAIDGLGDAKLAGEFRAAMDYTGAGNNPAFIRAFYKLAQQVTEGRHVSGNGPSPAGQQSRNQPGSAAKAMYPNLP